MLRNLKVNKKVEQRYIEFHKTGAFVINNIPSLPENIYEPGIYNSSVMDLLIGPNELFDEKPLTFEDEFDLFDDSDKSQYGVADSIEQIKEYFKEEIEDTEKFYFIEAKKFYQNSTDMGFPWNKMGRYIGNYHIRHEYFDMEDFGADFPGYLYMFHIYPLKDK